MNIYTTSNNADGGTTSPASKSVGSFSMGLPFTITATANDGYAFVAWLDEEGRIVTTNTTFTSLPSVYGTVDDDVTFKAIFIKQIGAVVYGFCGANCKHQVLTFTQTMHLIQEMASNGFQVPDGFINATPVNELIDQNTGTPYKLFVGTQAQYDSWTGDKTNVLKFISDDVTITNILSRLDALESATSSLDQYAKTVAEGANTLYQKVNRIVKGLNSDNQELISGVEYKKVLWNNPEGELIEDTAKDINLNLPLSVGDIIEVQYGDIANLLTNVTNACPMIIERFRITGLNTVMCICTSSVSATSTAIFDNKFLATLIAKGDGTNINTITASSMRYISRSYSINSTSAESSNIQTILANPYRIYRISAIIEQ